MASRRHQTPLRDLVGMLHQAREPASHEWTQLMREVGEARAIHAVDPSYPLVKIGHFDVIVAIGHGGFGIVFKAFDPDLERHVALKLCKTRSQHANDELIEEARKLARLAHPNIVTVHELGRHENAAYFAMPYLPENAEKLIRRNPTWQEVVTVYAKVARALAAAHRERVVHGDVKPKNILLDDDDDPFIADFGLARIVIEDTAESELEGLRRRAGTLYYMAPETLRGRACDELADQFSFWVSLLQTLNYGELPFFGSNTAEMLESIERFEIECLDPSVPEELLALIRRGLSEDPSERFPDMDTVADGLERLLQSPLPGDEPELDEPGAPEPEPPGDDAEREPASVGNDAPPSHELPQLIPVGGAAGQASKPRRGAFAVALVVVGALGWLGGRVESPGASEPEPVPLPTRSPCAGAQPNAKIDASVVAACERIREGDFERAAAGWDVELQGRREWNETRATAGEITQQELAAEVVRLCTDSMIVARTFLDRALASESDGQAAAGWAYHWASDAAAVLRADRPGTMDLKAAFARYTLMIGARDVQAQADERERAF